MLRWVPFLALWLSLGACVREAPPPKAAESTSSLWLTGLKSDDILTYRVQLPEGQMLTARYRVARLVRRGEGVAALLLPVPDTDYALKLSQHWLVGDHRALYRLDSPDELADPNFVPLDDQGRVLPSALGSARWGIPTEWGEDATGTEGGAWEVEELDMVVDGPIRGDRCAHVRQRDAQETRLTICGNLGLVVMVRQGEAGMGERWQLVAVGHAPTQVELQEDP